MKTSQFLFLGAALLLVGGTTLHSQQSGTAPRSVPQALQEMRARNQKLLEQQAATLQKLDELEKNAAQLRVFARRS
jgi:tRNA A37 N6-isopentenylltransferase MiaA